MEDMEAAQRPQRPNDRRNRETSIEAHEVQYSNSTKSNRYPHVFRFAADAASAADLVKPRILSYGCSTGEEVETLATAYFPDSDVTGVDVSASALAEARERFGSNPRVRFELSESQSLLSQPPFAVIFAMSVLCRWPETRTMTDASTIFPFKVFEHHVALLDRVLQPGGIMVIYNANYSFLHTKTSGGYDLVLHPRIREAGFVRRFHSDGKYLDGKKATDCVYWKKAASEPADPHRITIRDAKLRVMGCVDRGTPIDAAPDGQ